MPGGYRLASELSHRRVALVDGAIVKLRADSFTDDGEDYVFFVLLDGDAGSVELEVARFPKTSALEPEGGWMGPR